MIRVTEPGIYTMPAETYHADPAADPSLSSGIGRLLLSHSPAHAWVAHPRLNPRYKAEEKDAFDLGSAAHALLLEGSDRMTVIDAEDFRTKHARELRDQARAEGRHPVLASRYKDVIAMAEIARDTIERCPDLGGLTLKDGKAEQSIFWREAGVWCRIRPDWRANDGSVKLDYKTTSASASPESWPRTMAGMGGEFQAAFYTRGCEAVGDPHHAPFVFVVQETEPPYACSLQALAPGYMELGMSKVEEAIRTWAKCLKANRWPGYPDRICYIEPPAWELTRWEERKAVIGTPYDPSKLWEKEPS